MKLSMKCIRKHFLVITIPDISSDKRWRETQGNRMGNAVAIYDFLNKSILSVDELPSNAFALGRETLSLTEERLKKAV